ncbi:MAG: BamA/TamA family outer membrane protein [Planctomycetes bacterium]|nr:BamA/TamA family outer membrane protein [Planctomycetota bacterium]
MIRFPRLGRVVVPGALVFLLAAAGALQAQGELGPPRLSLDQDPPQAKPQSLEDEPDTTSFYPIPAIASGKNEGWTYGLLGALLLPDEKGDINKVVAFALQYRNKVKLNGFADFRWSVTPTAVFEAYSYWAQKVENENQVFFDDRRLWGDYNFRFDFDEKRVGTERFFGKGIATKKNAESSYTSNSYLTQLKFGPYLAEQVSLQGSVRVRHFRVGESILPSLPQMLVLFPNEFGIEGGEVFAEGLRLTYDTRNTIFTPTSGGYVIVFMENAHYLLGGAAIPFQAYGVEIEELWPHTDDAQFVTVARLKAQFVVGDAPFWELSTLGGGSSLRSFGPNRFTDNDAWVLNLEERIRLFTVRVEGVTGEIQLAPFFDLGEVFRHTQDVARPNVDRRLHWSIGSGFRAVVHPYIVGRMDVGFGTEGVGITVGLDYPF